MGFLDNLNNPAARLGLRMLANNRWNSNLGSSFGEAAIGDQQDQQASADNAMRQQLMQAQIAKMNAPQEDNSPLEVILGPDGKPRYARRGEAVGQTPYADPKGTASDTGMIQEWKASGEPDYFKFLQRRSEMVNPKTAAQEPLVIIQTPSGPMYVPRSQAAGSTPAATRENPQEGERTSANYYGRMDAAEKLLGEYVPSTMDYIAADRMMKGGPTSGSLANMALSAEGQKYYQAAADWVRAKLRKESGAVISPEEMAQEIKTYFPLPGDDKAVISQKKQSRAQAMSGMKEMGGRAITTPAAPSAPASVDDLLNKYAPK